MTDTISLLRQCHKMVWDFRRDMSEIAPGWATPDTLDSLRFAVTEVVEGLDAFLREKGGYARNNGDKDHSLDSELADCAMMLLTAMGDKGFIDWQPSRRGQKLGKIVWYVATAMDQHESGSGSWIFSAQSALDSIALYPDLNLKLQLSYRLLRLKQKHANPVECHQ